LQHISLTTCLLLLLLLHLSGAYNVLMGHLRLELAAVVKCSAAAAASEICWQQYLFAAADL
jgi:hypothetical protein